MAEAQALVTALRERTREMLGALAVASLAALAPPATALGIGLAGVLMLAAARLDLARAVAALWSLAIIPLYINLPGLSIPVDLLLAPILITRVFLVERRSFGLPNRLDWLLAAMFLTLAAGSAILSPSPVQAGYHLLRTALWLCYIPLGRAVYTNGQTAAPSVAVLVLATGAQAGLGLAQLALDNPFTVAVLSSPVASAFIPAPALESKLAAQDFNWITFGRAFPSGLFLNAIVFGVCLSVAGMILLGVPARWMPAGRAGLCRVGGAIALLVAFLAFKLTAWIGMLAGGVAAALLRIAQPGRRLRALLLPSLALVAIALGLSGPLERRLSDIATGSLVTRLLAWYTYLTNLPHHGMLGLGLGQAGVLAPAVPSLAAGQRVGLELAPESSLVGLAVEAGAPAALGLYAWLGLLAFRRRPFRAAWALPAMVTALVGNVGVYGLTDDHIMPLVALLAGLASAPASEDG